MQNRTIGNIYEMRTDLLRSPEATGGLRANLSRDQLAVGSFVGFCIGRQAFRFVQIETVRD
jgi:hypothetical protein